jgi:hypothetical protein
VAPKAEVKAAPKAEPLVAPKAEVKAAPKAEPLVAPKAEAKVQSKPTAEDTKVSQRQPSQLKSTVRSLANKDDQPRGGSSFASKKVADVAAPIKATDARETVSSTTEKVGE